LHLITNYAKCSLVVKAESIYWKTLFSKAFQDLINLEYFSETLTKV
jgi:hypothetical protein